MHMQHQLHHCDLPPGCEVQITVCMHGGVADYTDLPADYSRVACSACYNTTREYSLFTTACTRLDPTPTMPAPSAPSETNLSGKGKGAEGEKNE